MKTLQWSRINPDGPGLHRPKRLGDVGFDLEAAESKTIAPGEHLDIPTNVRVRLPEDCWGEIRCRSSIAQMGIQVAATVIDNGYTGHLFVLVYNTMRRHNGNGADWLGRVEISKGQRIAQLVVHQGVACIAQEVNYILDDPRRGDLGFGSTGV